MDTSYKNFLIFLKRLPHQYKYTNYEDNTEYISNYIDQFKRSIHKIENNKNIYNGDNFIKKHLASPLFYDCFLEIERPQYKHNFWQEYFILLDNVKNVRNFYTDSTQFINVSDLMNWCDIESQMTLFFKRYSKFLENYITAYKKFYNSNNHRFINPEQRLNLKNEILFNFHSQLYQRIEKDNKIHSNYTNVFMVPLIFMLLRHCSFQPLTNNLYNFLFKELKRFEDKFNVFLKSHNRGENISKDNNIIKHTSFTQLKYETIKKLTNNQPYNLITFNYTNDETTKCNNNENVHSTIDDHPIFGIDSSNNFDKPYYKFTKTYRIMKLSNKSNPHILDLNKNEHNEIIFYGQSLANADYMYFEAIFNHYKIYSNTKIQLIFCYSSKVDHNEEKRQFTRIYKLMNKYGKQYDHQDLLHKLLLEGRLHIRNIDKE